MDQYSILEQSAQTHNNIYGLFHFGIVRPHPAKICILHTQEFSGESPTTTFKHTKIYGLFHFGIVRPNQQQYLWIIPFWNTPPQKYTDYSILEQSAQTNNNIYGLFHFGIFRPHPAKICLILHPQEFSISKKSYSLGISITHIHT